MLERWYDVIAGSMLFSDISKTNAIEMLKCMNPRFARYEKGEFVARWREPMEGLGILLEGSLAVIKENVDGRRVIMNILKAGDLFGEMAVFSEHRFWPATICAQEDSSVMFIPPDTIVGRCAHACSYHKQVNINMLKLISEKALRLNRKMEYLSIKGMREKLCTYFWEEYKKHGKFMFILPMNRNELAEFLNVSRPSMSREMSRMREEGLIDFQLSAIKILNPDRLAEFVQ